MSASDMNPREALVGSLRRLGAGDSEPPGKMAYLSLTSKNEGPLRDAVAWQLHRTLAGASGIGVAKEWKRFDIAVLENGMPVALVEAKAGYAAEMIDAERPNTYLRDAVRKDIDKLRNNCWAATAGCWRFVLVFLTYNHQVPVAPDGVLRSYGRRRRLVKGAEPTVRRSDLECAPYYGDEEIRQGFSCYLVAWGDLPVVASGQVPAGKAFGTRVERVLLAAGGRGLMLHLAAWFPGRWRANRAALFSAPTRHAKGAVPSGVAPQQEARTANGQRNATGSGS